MESLYDEFGNYVGPELDESEEEDEEEPMEEDEDAAEAAANARMGLTTGAEDGADGAGADEEDDDDAEPGMQVVLHEDKKYYPTAEETYGPDTETLVMEEDAQPLEVPIVAPVRQKQVEVQEREALRTLYGTESLTMLMGNPGLCRNVALVGHLHHGKTLVMDMLVEQTHDIRHEQRQNDKAMRFTDTRLDEQDRGISVKMVPMSLLLPASSGKSFLFNLIDTPGHINFNDEVAAGLRLADGVLLCVDVAEGCMVSTDKAVKAALAEGLPIALLLTKVDRLIVELKLPPTDAYHKIRHTIDEVNALIAAYSGNNPNLEVHPVKGNVAFSAANSGWSFTLRSFAQLYLQVHGVQLDVEKMAKRLWGDVYYHPTTRTFKTKPQAEAGGEATRTFVEFILEPLYKIYSQVVGEPDTAVQHVLDEFGVYLKSSTFSADVKPLLKEVCSRVFGGASGLVDLMTAHFPSSRDATAHKVERTYTGPQDLDAVQHMKACNPRGPLMVHITKLFPKQDCSAFDALGRILSGTVKPGDAVRVLGEAYSPDDEEDSTTATITSVWAYQARYRVPLTRATAGNLVLLEGIDPTIFKTATLVPPLELWEEDVYIFRPLQFQTQAVVKIACEPLNPSELPKMVEGLRKINKSYPLAVTKVEESGEHAVLGTGEIYLDSLMKDLRELYAEVEVKVADPVVAFCETVVETSSLKCFAETPNRANKLTMIAEPLDRGLAEDIETGRVDIEWSTKKLGDFFVNGYDWDILAARSIWAFGPDKQGANVLLDDTLPSETDKSMLQAVRSSIVQGFQWGSKEGPLCDEPIRNVKFKMLDAQVAPEAQGRSAGMVIPTARRVCYSAFLMATPRLMEPVYYVEIQTPADCITAIYTVLARRRGHVTADVPKPGTPIFIVKAFLPVLESFGFETDLRYHTQGQAFCMSVFDHWQIVPGDPLDRTVQLRALEPAAPNELARELMVKTRRRKGMSEDVSISRFFDEPMLLEMARQEASLGQIL